MGFIQEFKAFAIKGNVVDLAIGLIIGSAFGKIVASMVEDIIMPFVGIFTGKGMFADKYILLRPAKEGDVYATLDQAKKAGANVLTYGHFLQTVFDFLIVALVIFIMVKAMMKIKKKEEVTPATPQVSTTDALLMEIRDSLKK
jgi:large conductance mechanosensitive channel